MTFFCGFELGLSEVSSQSGLTITNDSIAGPIPGLPCSIASIAAGGNVTWTLSEIANKSPSVVSCQLKVLDSTNGTALRVVKGTKTFALTYSCSSSGATTYTLTISEAGQSDIVGSAILNIPIGWTELRLVVAAYYTYVFVRGAQYIALVAGTLGSITEIKAIGGTTAIKVDDFVLRYTSDFTSSAEWHVISWKPSPTGDRYIQHTRSPATSTNSACVDDTTTDDDTTYIVTPSTGDKIDTYQAVTFPASLGYHIGTVGSLKTIVRSKLATTGSGNVYAGIRLSQITDPVYSAAHALTTSYQSFIDYFPVKSTTIPINQSLLTNYFIDPALLLVIKSSTSGPMIRTTQFVGALLVSTTKDTPITNTNKTGSLDIKVRVNASSWPAATHWLHIITNLTAVPIDAEVEPENLYIVILKELDGGSYKYFITAGVGDWDTAEILTCGEKHLLGTASTFDLRVVVHNEYVSVFYNETWCYTFSFGTMNYPSNWDINLESSYATTVSNIMIAELADWREAIYIDMTSSGASAVSSIIQERPIEILPRQGGIVDFSYNLSRSQVTPAAIVSHRKVEVISPSAGSHYIVYYADVAVFVDSNYMDECGYMTKVLQLSSLESGAIAIAQQIARASRERQESHDVDLPPDLRLEPGDVVVLGYTLSGTERVVSSYMIVESIELKLVDGDYIMHLGGRKYVT
jgi:hypothetical protein